MRLATRVTALLLALCAGGGCDLGPDRRPDIALYADGLDSPRGLPPQAGVSFVEGVSTDGRGSVRIDAHAGRTEVILADAPIEAPKLPRLTARGRLRSENLSGRAYLELQARLPGGRVEVARATHSQLSGTSDWSTHEANLFFDEGEAATRAILRVVVEGPGVVWVDAITIRAGRR